MNREHHCTAIILTDSEESASDRCKDKCGLSQQSMRRILIQAMGESSGVVGGGLLLACL